MNKVGSSNRFAGRRVANRLPTLAGVKLWIDSSMIDLAVGGAGNETRFWFTLIVSEPEKPIGL